MDEAAPITWLINRITELVSTGAQATAAAIATKITPLVSVAFGIYMILITVNYLRGAESEPVFDFALRSVAFAVIIGLGLNADNYSAVVIPIVTGLGGDLANAVSGGTANANTLDTLALFYLKIIDDGFEAASSQIFPGNISSFLLVGVKTLIIFVGLIPFLVSAALALVVAQVGSLLIAMVGPIFFAFLLFPATRQYFSAWLNSALSYALIPLFVAVIAVISVSISKEMLSTGGTLAETSFTSVFLAAIGNLVLLLLLRQVSALASALSAGGINAGGIGGIGSVANTIRAGGAGSVREARGALAAYRGGREISRRISTAIANRSNAIRKAG